MNETERLLFRAVLSKIEEMETKEELDLGEFEVFTETDLVDFISDIINLWSYEMVEMTIEESDDIKLFTESYINEVMLDLELVDILLDGDNDDDFIEFCEREDEIDLLMEKIERLIRETI